MTNYVWIVGGGLLQVPAVEAARSLGLGVIVSDKNPDCACAGLADIFVELDTYDAAGHVTRASHMAHGLKIVGVFTEGADVEVTVAETAHALGLPGIPPSAARNCNDKTRMRVCFDGDVRWTDALTVADAERAASYIGYPLIVKPADNCASRGVRRVTDPGDVAGAVRYAADNSRSGRVLLEEFLSGPQQSVEIIWIDGRPLPLNIVDRLFAEDGVTELGHINPSSLDDAVKIQLYDIVTAASRAVGVTWGVFKADTIWTLAGPRILECTARLSGGFDCQYTTPLSSGRNFIRAAMAQACGIPVSLDDLGPTRSRYSAAWAAFPPAGRVREILSDVVDHDPDTLFFLRVKPGDVVEHHHNADRAGFAIATADTYAAVLEKARIAAGRLSKRIVIES